MNDLNDAAAKAAAIRESTENVDEALQVENLKSHSGIGVAIRHWRTMRGWTISAVATSAALSEFTLAKIERGESSPTLSTLVALANALNIDVTTLLLDARRADPQMGVLA